VTVAKNRERGLDVEDAACERWPLDPVAEDRDERDSWYDLEFIADVEIELSSVPVVEAGTLAEVKSCYPDYDDRAGRWWIRRENHEKLVDAEGVYVLAVVERNTERVLRMALVDARTIDVIIDGDWWDAGDGGRSADQYRQISWTAIFKILQNPRGESA
jgi:hypothetical protein